MTLTLEEYKLDLILHREWKQKTDPAKVTAKINSSAGKQIIATETVQFHYTRFEQGNHQFFDKSLEIVSFPSQFNKNLSNSQIKNLLSVEKEGGFKQKMVTKDGRFLFIHYWNNREKKYCMDIYDLFKAKKSSTLLLPYNCTLNFLPLPNNLLLMIETSKNSTPELFTLKINPNTLSFTKTEIRRLYLLHNIEIVLLDRLDTQKIAVCDNHWIQQGKVMEQGKIVWDKFPKHIGKYFICGRRLIGKKLQGFSTELIREFNGQVIYNPSEFKLELGKFHEFDLDTMEQKEVEVPKILKDNREMYITNLTENCWSMDYFYAMCQTNLKQPCLFSFNLKTSQWIDVQISTSGLCNMFVDENETLTLCVRDKKIRAFYRVGLGRPDKLLALTLAKAVQESDIYGNGKYINLAKEIQF